jgi:hypothetical protein
MVEPQLAAASDNDSDRLMDSDDARDYADQFQHLDDLDRLGTESGGIGITRSSLRVHHGRQPAPLNDHLSIFSNNFLELYNIINYIILNYKL